MCMRLYLKPMKDVIAACERTSQCASTSASRINQDATVGLVRRYSYQAPDVALQMYHLIFPGLGAWERLFGCDYAISDSSVYVM